jgi:hypothetical protein
MCFVLYSLSIPTQDILPEFDVILPYPSPAKINGIYDQIFTLWNPNALATSAVALPADSELSLYFEAFLSPTDVPLSSSSATEAAEDDSIFSSVSPLRYDLYVSTFQFQYSPLLMGSNVSNSLLASQSESIFTQVSSTLYDERMSNQTAATTNQFVQPLQLLKAEAGSNDPCGYDLIAHSLHDVSELLLLLLPLLIVLCALEQYCDPNGLSRRSEERLYPLSLSRQFTVSLLDPNSGRRH